MDAPDKGAKPKHPERICWGCDNYCPANDLQCGNRTLHPVELSWSSGAVGRNEPREIPALSVDSDKTTVLPSRHA